MEIIIKDGECKKMERKNMDLEIEMRQMKKKLQQFNMEIAAKEREAKKLHDNHLIMLTELRKLKNQLNTL